MNTQIISVTAGKGGVGKTTMAINLAIALAKQHKKVMLFDADLGLSNVDVSLGLHTKKNISHVLSGGCALQDICVKGPAGITIIPAASGIQQLSDLSALEANSLIHAFSTLTQDVDVLLIDTAAGISNQVVSFVNASQEVLVVLTNDPASFADAYALIKLMHKKYQVDRFWIVANMVRRDAEGQQLFKRLNDIVNRFLQVNLYYLGEVPYDDYMYMAIKNRCALLEQYPGAQSARAISKMGDCIAKWKTREKSCGKSAFFLENLLECQQA